MESDRDGPAAGTLTTRRDFLEASAAAAALLALPWAAGEARAAAAQHDREIVAAAIHPAIGIARVGNSRDTFYVGPEVPGQAPRAPGGFKDAHGAVARQAARFRVYGLDARGRVVRELTSAEARIAWRVDVANAKAAWYEFTTAFDIPDAEPADIRNADVVGAARADLVVAPGERSIEGPAARPVSLDGRFLGRDVSLGELMTDGAGRLVVLPGPGRGVSDGAHPLTSFASNDGWTDDACDGAVRATVRIGGRTIEAEPAWVLTTPPNYGPGVVSGFVTAYDSVRSMFASADELPRGPVSFADDILPIFTRLVDMQWVNAGYLEENGFGSGEDWTTARNVRRLADGSKRNAAFRQELFERFRRPSYRQPEPDAIPDMYGDGVAIPATSPRQWLTVTPLQYAQLRAWARGRFDDDRAQAARRPTRLSRLPVARQPQALDRAALESCLGGAYHPGIEAPWVLRQRSLWQRPFRLRVRTTAVEARDWGPQLTAEIVLGADGPLQGVAPGELTRWLGVPWHADAASCRSGYEPSISPVLPTFWPARIPNHVLTEEDYEIVMDRSRPLRERRAAFRRRPLWDRFIFGPNGRPSLDLMVSDWAKMGVVEDRPGPGDRHFPKRLKVETGVGFTAEPPAP